MTKLLIIRFSSIGDILQCMGVVNAVLATHPNCEIHWIVRDDLKELPELHTGIKKIWPLDRKSGLRGLYNIGRNLSKEKFTHVYDAHNNLRSHILIWILRIFSGLFRFKRKSKERLRRFLLFQFRLNLFPKPYIGRNSFLLPLKSWKILPHDQAAELLGRAPPIAIPSPYIVLVPSAAWDLKIWPLTHWKALIQRFPQMHFVVLGGEKDSICDEVASLGRAINLKGRLDFKQSVEVIRKSHCIVSGDTSLLHMADLLGHPAIELIGPTPFGYPFHPNTKIAEVDLACRPCSKDGRGKCHNRQLKKCMDDVSPGFVAELVLGFPKN